jgi:hypothetical protein
LPDGKVAGLGVNHPSPSSAEVKERVELYIYFPSGPSWPVLGHILTLPQFSKYVFKYFEYNTKMLLI